jgi:hypothetical protein
MRRRAALGLALPFAACAGVPLLEVEEARFAAPIVPLPQRAVQVERAAAGLGWRVETPASGLVRVSREDGGRSATVGIRFDPVVFSIHHEFSQGLTRTAYNVWVAALRDAIVAQSGI